jgi:hypothetical protein
MTARWPCVTDRGVLGYTDFVQSELKSKEFGLASPGVVDFHDGIHSREMGMAVYHEARPIGDHNPSNYEFSGAVETHEHELNWVHVAYSG